MFMKTIYSPLYLYIFLDIHFHLIFIVSLSMSVSASQSPLTANTAAKRPISSQLLAAYLKTKLLTTQ